MGGRSRDSSPKKTYRWPRNTWKDVQRHSLLEKCKSKPLWGTTLHQPEWPSSKSLQTINAGEGVEKREPYYTLGGNINWCNHCGKQYGGSSEKLNIELPLDPAIPLLGIYPEKIHDSKRYMHPNVHCSAIYNSQDMETNLMAIDREVDQEDVVHIHKGLLLSH